MSHQRSSSSIRRRPAHLQQQQQQQQAQAATEVQPLPPWAVCPGAPRIYPVSLPPSPSEQHFGLYTPPVSPPLTPTYAHAQPAQVAASSRRSPRGSSDGYVPSLFPDVDINTDNDDPMMMSYTGNFYLANAGARAQPTANELWLQHYHPVQGGQGVSSSSSPTMSWMPAPSSSVHIRSGSARRQASIGSDVGPYDARRVRFAWGTEVDNDDALLFNQNNGHGGKNGNNDDGNGYGYGGGRRRGGYGYGSAGSKRSWGGRREVDGERDDDENDEDTVDEEQERRARRRGR